jgi:hypothetical protein
MADAARDLLRHQACAFNGRDLDNLAAQAEPDAPCFCDGEWVGEGPSAMREALEREFTQEANLVARMAVLDDEPILVELSGGEGHWHPRGTLRIRGNAGGRIREMRIDHREPIVSAVVPEPSR